MTFQRGQDNGAPKKSPLPPENYLLTLQALECRLQVNIYKVLQSLLIKLCFVLHERRSYSVVIFNSGNVFIFMRISTVFVDMVLIILFYLYSVRSLHLYDQVKLVSSQFRFIIKNDIAILLWSFT